MTQEKTPLHETEGRAQTFSLGKTLIWIALAVLVIVIGAVLLSNQEEQISPGSIAPDFSLTTFDGEETYTLSDYRGQVVVINFWASWCTTCKYEAEDLETAWNMYGEDVLFLGVAYQDSLHKALDYINTYGITYPNGNDAQGLISRKYGVKSVPETVVIDKDGVVAFYQIGMYNSLDEIITQIESLLRK